jgi:hypothetical protein
MASFETVTGALQNDARTDASKAPNAASFGGKLHVERHEYVLTDAEAANDTIDVCWLPVGAVVVPHLSCVAASGDPGTTLTLDIGTSDDADRFANEIVLSAGGAAILFSSATLPEESHNPTPLTTATKVICTVATAASLADTRTLVFWLAYTLP